MNIVKHNQTGQRIRQKIQFLFNAAWAQNWTNICLSWNKTKQNNKKQTKQMKQNYLGLPLVVIPVLADQHRNARQIVRNGNQ